MKNKKKITILSLLVMSIFSSCNNSEYVYNEGVSARYYELSTQFEKCYEELLQEKYQTKFEYNNDEFSNFNPSAVAARNLKKNAAYLKGVVNLLKPSKKAQSFHNKILEYFDMVGVDFADKLQSLADLSCDCPEQKEAIVLALQDLYSRISKTEDACLDEQKKYLKSVGLPVPE